MMNNMCFDRTFLLLLVTVIIVLSLYQHFAYQKEIDNIRSSCASCGIPEEQNQLQPMQPMQQMQQMQPMQPMQPIQQMQPIIGSFTDPFRDYDYRTLADPLVPPYKRDDYNIPIMPLPTRGYPSSYKKMGTLLDKTADNNDSYRFLFLIGRQKYPGADIYDYYATEKGSEGNGALKFDLPHLRKELYTGDTVHIKQLNKDYEITVDRNLGFDYNPFMY